MTEKRCTDCKYTKGIGYDFWCGEGHTEYEVFGAETNCPYYEYHDWSKSIPSRTEKRFTETLSTGSVTDNENGKEYKCEMRIDDKLLEVMNALHEENTYLKLELDTHKHPLWSTREAERKVNELTELLANETKKNAILLEEINSLRIENMRLKEVNK